jgi:ABC-type multidrug transport system ATPase subunit
MNSSNKCRNCQFNDNSPSGAGKSTLLNILAGRTKSNKNLTVSADVRLDSYSVDPTDVGVRKQIAFVAQDDSLTQTSTPREAIRFSAKLRLPRTTTDDELDALVSLERLCLHYSISNFTS